MLVDTPILALCSIITPTFISQRKHLVIGQLNDYQFFSAFHWSTRDTPPISQCIAVQWPKSETVCGPCIAAIAVCFCFFCFFFFFSFVTIISNSLALYKGHEIMMSLCPRLHILNLTIYYDGLWNSIMSYAKYMYTKSDSYWISCYTLNSY